jgi:hypothetical protein
MDCTQAAAPKRRETPRSRPGKAGLRLYPKWLGYKNDILTTVHGQSSTSEDRTQHIQLRSLVLNSPPWLHTREVFFCSWIYQIRSLVKLEIQGMEGGNRVDDDHHSGSDSYLNQRSGDAMHLLSSELR